MKFNIKKHGENINLTTDKKFEFNGKTLLDIFYPINSIYMTTGEQSPASMFGGTWERIENTFLLASGSLYANGSVGGEKDHILTIEEMPNHTHTTAWNNMIWNDGGGNIKNPGSGSKMISSSTTCSYTGGGLAHNNLPPYLAVNIWKRIP